MRRVTAFENVSVDGYFVDDAGDMSWAHRHDPEWTAFSGSNAGGSGELLFGRVTYEMMASFWPTPQAAQLLPEVAKGMNGMPKHVCSRTLDAVGWQNTTLHRGDAAEAVRRLKSEPGPDLVILGSGTLVADLAGARLVDAYQLVLVPVVLGTGRTLFQTVADRFALTLRKTRAFSNGNVVLWYDVT